MSVAVETAHAGIGRKADGIRATPDAPEMRVSFADHTGHADLIERAVVILRREGVVLLDHLVDPMLLEACRAEIVERYPDYATPDAARYLGSFPGRHTAPLVVDGMLADPAIFAPRAIRDIGQALLGPENILESLGLLVSIPGAPDQGRHYDGLLYLDNQLDRVMPPFAISISMPLVALDERNGTTAFWRRSHREPPRDGPPDFVPLVSAGSAVIWDFRTHHSGRGNLSDQPRPILFSVHSRDWWQEPKTVKATHYKKLQIASAVRDGFGKNMRAFTCRAEIVA